MTIRSIAISTLLAAMIAVGLPAQAQPAEDTITVQTFTYGSDLRQWFEFPDDSNSYRKIWMYYKLKCDEGTTADNYPCGEWDYLTYTFLYDHTGNYDSTLLFQPNFVVDGETPGTYGYMDNPSWNYTSRPVVESTVTDTASFFSFELAEGQDSIFGPVDSRFRTNRQYYLWKAADLQAAGLTAGDIVGLTLHPENSTSNTHRLIISMTHSELESIDFYQDQDITGQEVFDGEISVPDTGWKQITFREPFAWDGTGNVLISFSTHTPGPADTLRFRGYGTGYTSNAHTVGNEYSLNFNGQDHVAMDKEVAEDIDSFISISLLQYGNPQVQPQNDWVFEGVDADGERIVSCHLPWGNENVYWDAGNDGSGYDRLQKAANPADYEGRWNHWVFTKDAAKGEMKMYLNGELWDSTAGRSRIMEGIEEFLIGSNASGEGNYDGKIDEIAIWDRVLSGTEISDLAFRKLDDLAAIHSGLLAYFPFDEGQLQTAGDPFSNRQGHLFGMPGWQLQPVDAPAYGFRHNAVLPDIKFQQGEFDYSHDTTHVVDSTMKDPVSIVLFSDSAQALMPTDTLARWPRYSRLIFDEDGQAIDSVEVPANHVLERKEWPYYGPPFEVVNRYELMRYITPYGIGLDLGAQGDGEGFTWKMDVTDFAPLLADSVELSAGNNQEFLDMKFVMIKGTPPREVQRIENVYSGSHRYNAAIETDFLKPKTFSTTTAEKMACFRIANTGHGFGGNENCAEFCAKTHRVKVNGSKRFDQHLWRDNCAMNPVYPQGGTWIYDRTNWCPGAEVDVDKYEITPFYEPGEDVTLDYDMEPGYSWNGNGSAPTWRIEAQLVTYGAPSFTHDAEMEMIIAPNDWAYFKRFNPHCANPVVRIRNSGSETLSSVKITYGVKGGVMRTYEWTGELAFLESEEVTLPAADFGPYAAEERVFVASVSQPNGQADEHDANNLMETTFEAVPQYPEEIVLWLKTNGAPSETHYEVLDHQGNVVHSGDNFQANTLYKDTLRFEDPGCYRFVLYDRGENGLSFFGNNDGNGYARLMQGLSSLRQFQPNFGRQIAQSFTVGYGMAVPQTDETGLFEVYPNPTGGQIHISASGKSFEQGILQVQNNLGQVIWQKSIAEQKGFERTLDLSRFGKGMYLVQWKSASGSRTSKVVVE